jgi:protein-S-isoprenylcysteine O-methyltransferase Ste14
MLKLPPPIWALIYLIAAGIVSALYPWGALVSLRVVWLGVVLAIAGFAVAFSGAGLFWRKGTEINPTWEANKTLVMTGPYRLTRNPMYLGLVVFTLGIALCFGSLPMFAVPILVFATVSLVHIPFEEAKMRRQFGPVFDDYTHRVRRWI